MVLFHSGICQVVPTITSLLEALDRAKEDLGLGIMGLKFNLRLLHFKSTYLVANMSPRSKLREKCGHLESLPQYGPATVCDPRSVSWLLSCLSPPQLLKLVTNINQGILA